MAALSPGRKPAVRAIGQLELDSQRGKHPWLERGRRVAKTVGVVVTCRRRSPWLFGGCGVGPLGKQAARAKLIKGLMGAPRPFLPQSPAPHERPRHLDLDLTGSGLRFRG